MARAVFKRIGGHLAADFINTVHGRVSAGAGGGRDYADRIVADKLTDFGDLVDWALGSGTLTRPEVREWRTDGAAAREALERAVRFREALYRICKAKVEGWAPRPSDFGIFTTVAQTARAAQRLTVRGGSLQWSWPPTRDRDRVIWPVALAAATLLGGDEAALLRQCPGDNCGWLFLDQTRNHSRQWCDMADCGNRAKVRRHRTQAARSRRS